MLYVITRAQRANKSNWHSLSRHHTAALLLLLLLHMRVPCCCCHDELRLCACTVTKYICLAQYPVNLLILNWDIPIQRLQVLFEFGLLKLAGSRLVKLVKRLLDVSSSFTENLPRPERKFYLIAVDASILLLVSNLNDEFQLLVAGRRPFRRRGVRVGQQSFHLFLLQLPGLVRVILLHDSCDVFL